MKIIKNYADYDAPMRLVFTGSAEAEMFTEEVADSLEGVLRYNFYRDPENIGFCSASVGGRPWDGTMWSRDAGVFLRELSEWGYLGTACLLANRLTECCGRDADGYRAFAEHYAPGEKAFGEELDGTSAILIGMSLLCERLADIGTPEIKEIREKLLGFLGEERSPAAYILKRISESGLAGGSGEFGSGYNDDRVYANSVQNCLALYALRAVADALPKGAKLAGQIEKALPGYRDAIKKYFVADGKLVWALDVQTLKPAKEVNESALNKGTALINGAGAMYCDVYGMDMSDFFLKEEAEATFLALLNSPAKKKYFDKYGIYIQFDEHCGGMLSSPSYGQGYACQLALLTGKAEIADRLLCYLARATRCPHPDYVLSRPNSNYFYERFLVDEYFAQPKEKQTIGEGCGALNLVNVAEPLKIARIIAGVSMKNGSRMPHYTRHFTGCEIIK